VHKAQVHIDLSGWSPKYFPPQPRRIAVVPEVSRLATGKADLRWAGRQFADPPDQPPDDPQPEDRDARAPTAR
jgi:hypothetical protein